ncbi:MAG: HDIG domain-containing protein [Candidatus Lokiarchaeota archaeon]|nr:HDIG domain-containing protein [Candidatus Lokiarchaeota archaeon]
MHYFEDDDLSGTAVIGYIPSKTEAIKILQEMNLSKNIVNHVLAVSRKAIKFATKISAAPVNFKLVRIGAILHDIGRVRSHDYDHAVIGGQIIREELKFSEQLARIAETHILGGISKEEAKEFGLPPKDYFPESVEEKIVCLADKYFIGVQQVSIEQRFKNWFARYGENEFLLRSKKRVEDLEIFIYKLMFP